jgi:hypothetical protein
MSQGAREIRLGEIGQLELRAPEDDLAALARLELGRDRAVYRSKH